MDGPDEGHVDVRTYYHAWTTGRRRDVRARGAILHRAAIVTSRVAACGLRGGSDSSTSPGHAHRSRPRRPATTSMSSVNGKTLPVSRSRRTRAACTSTRSRAAPSALTRDGKYSVVTQLPPDDPRQRHVLRRQHRRHMAPDRNIRSRSPTARTARKTTARGRTRQLTFVETDGTTSTTLVYWSEEVDDAGSSASQTRQSGPAAVPLVAAVAPVAAVALGHEMIFVRYFVFLYPSFVGE